MGDGLKIDFLWGLNETKTYSVGRFCGSLPPHRCGDRPERVVPLLETSLPRTKR